MPMYQLSTLARSPHVHARKAWLAFGYHLRWKFVGLDGVPPRPLLDFRDHSCLELSRSNAGSTWADIEGEVYPFEGDADCVPRFAFLHNFAINAARAPS